MIWFALLITTLGMFMTIWGVVIKKQMMLADSFTPSPKQEQARKFIVGLIHIVGGDVWKVYKWTQLILVLGLVLLIVGVTVLMVGTF